jgi:hypothetical protein
MAGSKPWSEIFTGWTPQWSRLAVKLGDSYGGAPYCLFYDLQGRRRKTDLVTASPTTTNSLKIKENVS